MLRTIHGLTASPDDLYTGDYYSDISSVVF